jgi:2-oxo-4-hydroxy-4-carboxy-5-ureidoimidazoline decarboxylase
MTLEELSDLDQAAFVEAVGWVFEHSPWVAERSWRRRPFGSFQALHRAMISEVETASYEQQLALLCAHPDLGSRAKMSSTSTAEQTNVGLDRLTPEEDSRFRDLNDAYRNKFGFPFLFAVRGSNKQQILAALTLRLESPAKEEFRVSLQQVYSIAGFRLHNLIDNQQEGKR